MLEGFFYWLQATETVVVSCEPNMNRTNNENSVYETKDLSLAAFLYASGKVKLISTRRLPNREIYFLYSPCEVAESLIQQYWNLQAPPIQPKILLGAIRDIKDLIFAG